MTVLIAALAVFVVTAAPQEVLTNASIEKLVKSGLSEAVIVGIVKSQTASFDLGAEAVIALKGAGVSNAVIEAMTARLQQPTATPAAAGDGATKVALKTPLRLIVSEDLSSGSAKSGQAFALTVADDLVVNGKVVIAKGASATGRVTAVTKKAFATRNGSLELTIDSARAVDGQDVPLDGRLVQDGGAAGFGSVGKNVSVSKGTPVSVVVAADREIGPKQ